MNRRIAEENNSPAGKILWAILSGVGLGLGFLIVRKIDEKYDFATRKQLADKKAMEEASRLYRPPKKK